MLDFLFVDTTCPLFCKLFHQLVVSGLMSENDYEFFLNWSWKFAPNFPCNWLLPQCILCVYLSDKSAPSVLRNQRPKSTRYSQHKAFVWEVV